MTGCKGPLPAVSRYRVPVTTAQDLCGKSPGSPGHVKNAARAGPQKSLQKWLYSG